MNATELRIGNLLQGTNVVTVTRIYDENKVGIGSGDPYHVQTEKPFKPCLYPIPITEEWLVRAGFVYDVNNVIKHKTHCGIEIPCGNTLGFYFEGGKVEITNTQIYSDGTELINLPPIKYIHQLQNLYFALTGKELTFKN